MHDERVETIRRLERDDLPAVSRLFRDVFGSERALEEWEWKYFGSPLGTDGWICEADGAIVVHAGAVRVPMREGARNFVGAQLVDFMSSRRHAGPIGRGGLFVRTTHRLLNTLWKEGGVRFCYGFPGERHRAVGERVLGYRSHEPVGELELEPSASGGRPEPLEESHLRHFESRSSDLRMSRGRELLAWRYLRRPSVRYGFLTVAGPFGLRRLHAIVRRDDDAIRIMELAGSLDERVVRRFASAVSSLGQTARFWCSLSHPVAQVMEASGFRAMTRDHLLSAAWFRPSDEWKENDRDPFIDRTIAGSMYYTMGDYDVW